VYEWREQQELEQELTELREFHEVATLATELQELATELGDWLEMQDLEAEFELAFENYKERTIKTERALRRHMRKKKWRLYSLPGRRSWNSPGPDLIAYKNGSLMLLDNKAYLSPSSAGTPVYRASGISPKSLVTNLPQLINNLAARSGTPKGLLDQLRATYAAADAALKAGKSQIDKKDLPKKVQLVVTNAGGQSKGVGGTLDDRMKFIDLARRMGLTAKALGVK
jgi:hypothetical protein